VDADQTPLPVRVKRIGLRIASLYTLVIALAGLAVVAFAMVIIRPKFDKIFADFGTQLPALTRLIMALSPMLVGAIAAAFAVILIVKEWLVPSKAVTLTANCLTIILSFAGLIALLIGLYLPMINLVGKVSEGH
jgi:type II secretory pathway component PulF